MDWLTAATAKCNSLEPLDSLLVEIVELLVSIALCTPYFNKLRPSFELGGAENQLLFPFQPSTPVLPDPAEDLVPAIWQLPASRNLNARNSAA